MNNCKCLQKYFCNNFFYILNIFSYRLVQSIPAQSSGKMTAAQVSEYAVLAFSIITNDPTALFMAVCIYHCYLEYIMLNIRWTVRNIATHTHTHASRNNENTKLRWWKVEIRNHSVESKDRQWKVEITKPW